jgi:two-component system alkaline phosphatase synthesis response regulator PhoP
MLRILLVEDDLPLLRTLTLNLGRRGHTVAEADGVESGYDLALAACEADAPFDLIVLETHLPDGSGWDLLRLLRAQAPINPCWRPTPVIIITPLPIANSRIVEFAPLAALLKPFPIEALLRLIERSVASERPAVPVST